MSEELPAKRPQEEAAEPPAKKAKKPLVSLEEWQPYTDALKTLEWPQDEDGEAKRAIAEQLASPEGLQAILAQLRERVAEPEPVLEIANLAQHINKLYNQVFNAE